jgi:TonB-linked SusC/RagA family outer membrane protein
MKLLLRSFNQDALQKIARIMRITAIFLLASCLTASAAGYGQKKLTIKLKDVSLEQVLDEINRQTGVPYLGNSKMLDPFQHLNVDIKDLSLDETLQKIMAGIPLSYHLENKYIIIAQKQDTSTASLSDKAPPRITLHGKIVDEKGQPLAKASVALKGTQTGTVTNDAGEFTLENIPSDGTLVVTNIGYENLEIKIKGKTDVHIVLKPFIASLQNLQVTYFTGYESISPERATGSFAQPNKYVYDNRVSTDVLSKLEGITSGLVFNTSGITGITSSTPQMTIRGLSTIYANTQPLVVVDNFPYDGDINNINPNDVESVTVLKDAAAASIWGVRAGNGVIVIKTKQGAYNRPLRIGFNSNVTVSQRPNLNYDPNFLDANDEINVEQMLFSNGYYNAPLSDPSMPATSPVVEILAQQQAGTITAAQAQQQIDAFRNLDQRGQLGKYFYQPAVNQQYYLNVSGGTAKSAYFLSGGYDDDRPTAVGSRSSRLTLNSALNFTPIKNLNILFGLNYIQANSTTDNTLGTISSTTYPYVQYADGKGNPLPIEFQYNQTYVNQVTGMGLLPLQYEPLQELRSGWNRGKSNSDDIRINTGVGYTFWKGFEADIKYQYEKTTTVGSSLLDQQAYTVRNLIDEYANLTTNPITYNLPLGDVLNNSLSNLNSNSVRGQLNFSNHWGNHAVTALAGAEVRQYLTSGNNSTLYGYNPANGSFTNINPTTYFTLNPSGASATIQSGLGVSSTTDRYRSYFANAAYTFKDRYTLSGSGRIDGSNYFGVNTNKKNVPLWSVGGKWDINKESFYHITWLPKIDLRATYGYNGNLDKNLTAITTFRYNNPPGGLTTLPNATILNFANPDLQWEKIGILNLGLDFSLVKNVVSGSLEYYHKNGRDLIGAEPEAPSTGVTTFTGNFSAMKGHGIDLRLTSINLRGRLTWTTTFLFSRATDVVIRYNGNTGVSSLLSAAKTILPIVGKPVYGVYSLPYAGLDGSGNPQGYDTTAKVSTNYATLGSPTKLSQLDYNGPARPTTFGGIYNQFTYRHITLAFNISYKMGYYFQRTSINYGSLFSTFNGNKDFTKRWQAAGDEKRTNVPSMIYPDDPLRDAFYLNSSYLIDKGDQIRLQDVLLNYDVTQGLFKKMPLFDLQLYIQANNLGILWRANKDHLDPDYPTGGIPAPRTISIGAKANF